VGAAAGRAVAVCSTGFELLKRRTHVCVSNMPETGDTRRPRSCRIKRLLSTSEDTRVEYSGCWSRTRLRPGRLSSIVRHVRDLKLISAAAMSNPPTKFRKPSKERLLGLREEVVAPRYGDHGGSAAALGGRVGRS